MAKNTFILFAISGILLVLFFGLMSSFTQTYSWSNTASNWAIFAAVVLLLVAFGLYKAFD